jgi:hypothetical protein
MEKSKMFQTTNQPTIGQKQATRGAKLTGQQGQLVNPS